jgi:hypothetical protein
MAITNVVFAALIFPPVAMAKPVRIKKPLLKIRKGLNRIVTLKKPI